MRSRMARSGQTQGGIVGREEPTVPVYNDGVRRGLEQSAIPFLTFPQRLRLTTQLLLLLAQVLVGGLQLPLMESQGLIEGPQLLRLYAEILIRVAQGPLRILAFGVGEASDISACPVLQFPTHRYPSGAPSDPRAIWPIQQSASFPLCPHTLRRTLLKSN